MISTSTKRIVETDPQTDPRWQNFVLKHPNASVYHHPAWLRVLQVEYPSSQTMHLACEGPDGQLTGILPMLFTRGLPLKLGGSLGTRRLSSLPRTPVAGPLAEDKDTTVALLQAAVSQVNRDPRIQLQIKVQDRELDGLVDKLACSPWRDSYMLQLASSSEGQFHIPNGTERAKIKWAIKKATRLGVHVRPAETKAELYQWYLLYLETMRRNAVPPRTYQFFAALWELLRPHGMMELLLAEQQTAGRSRIVAGSVFLLFNRTVSYAFNGSRLADLALRPNDVIQWQAINEACRKGFHSFDFGEVPHGNHDLAKFKSKWGATAVPLHRYYYPALLDSADDRGGFREYTTTVGKVLWCHLPLKATAWLGSRIYSYL
jgi:CelD/BcsL family acetyltransferase involved in cellulose biosynthesis